MINDVISIIFEKIDFSIDKDVRKLITSTKVRKEMINKYGDKSFLDPKGLKFPVINPKTGNYECTLIYSAMLRAIMFSSKNGSKTNDKQYYDKIRNKAKELYNKEQCGDKLKLKLKNESVDILFLNDVFSITETDHLKIIDITDYIE